MADSNLASKFRTRYFGYLGFYGGDKNIRIPATQQNRRQNSQLQRNKGLFDTPYRLGKRPPKRKRGKPSRLYQTSKVRYNIPFLRDNREAIARGSGAVAFNTIPGE